jgi:threonine synthase
MIAWPGVVRRYADWIDLLPSDAEAVTLLEGNTPLIPLPRVAQQLGAAEVWLKFEGLNPTGSFKDRGMTVAMTQARYRGAAVALCASTGNTAASAAAYASRAGLACYVVIPGGQVAVGKLAGAVAYGAQVLQIDGTFDRALELVRGAAEAESIELVNSLNPYRLEGQKTVAFEICETLGRSPDWLALPVGNAGNITAVWMGMRQYCGRERLTPPRLLGVQAAGAAPLVVGHPIEHPQTVASAIRIGRPARGDQALAAAGDSGGRIVAAPDEALLAAQHLLAAQGIWVEPASAAGLAGLIQEAQSGALTLEGQTVTIIATGHGLKDPDAITTRMPPAKAIEPTADALARALSL